MSRDADCQSGWALREHLLQPPSCANRETEVQREAMSFPGQCIVGLHDWAIGRVSIGIRKWGNLPGSFGHLLLDLYLLLSPWPQFSYMSNEGLGLGFKYSTWSFAPHLGLSEKHAATSIPLNPRLLYLSMMCMAEVLRKSFRPTPSYSCAPQWASEKTSQTLVTGIQ